MRDEIKNRERARQLISFKGLCWGSITPTDIDMFIEYHNKAYIIGEAKLFNADIPNGQMLALVRQCDDLQKVKPTYLIIARHNTPIDQDVDFANCIVEKFRHDGKWISMVDDKSKNWTVKQLLSVFIG